MKVLINSNVIKVKGLPGNHYLAMIAEYSSQDDCETVKIVQSVSKLNGSVYTRLVFQFMQK
jgi:hypothetical protein